jgi:hypothetical protein
MVRATSSTTVLSEAAQVAESSTNPIAENKSPLLLGHHDSPPADETELLGALNPAHSQFTGVFPGLTFTHAVVCAPTNTVALRSSGVVTLRIASAARTTGCAGYDESAHGLPQNLMSEFGRWTPAEIACQGDVPKESR